MCLAQGPQRSDAGEARTRIIAIFSLGLTYQVRIMTLASTAFKKSTFQKKFTFKCNRKQRIIDTCYG